MHLKPKPQHALFTSRKCTKQKGGWYTGALMFNYFAFTGDSYSFKPSMHSSYLSNLFASIYNVMMVGNATKLIIPLQSFPSLYVTFCKDRQYLIWPTPITHPGILNGHIVADSCHCPCFSPISHVSSVYNRYTPVNSGGFRNTGDGIGDEDVQLLLPALSHRHLSPMPWDLGFRRCWKMRRTEVMGSGCASSFWESGYTFFDTFQNSYHVWFFNFHFLSSLRVSLMSSQ